MDLVCSCDGYRLVKPLSMNAKNYLTVGSAQSIHFAIYPLWVIEKIPAGGSVYGDRSSQSPLLLVVPLIC